MAAAGYISENLELFQDEILKLYPLIQNDIVSVMADGSVVRGDFAENSSDIDITVTTANQNLDPSVPGLIAEIAEKAQRALPKRAFPRKPLIYDIQWQDIETVRRTGQRTLSEWNSGSVPQGYPKLWLYAFDVVQHHKVLYGGDVTGLYTALPPSMFVSVRAERLRKSVLEAGGGITAYEAEKGAITQIKNAWEAVRCLCIANGLESIHKKEVYNCAKRLVNDPERAVVEDLCALFENGTPDFAADSFRQRLCDFTLGILDKTGR